jgi:ABC-2 type transport system permease protein
VTAGRALARRAFADGKIAVGAFAVILAAMASANAVGYRHSYPTLKDRLGLARTFGQNEAVQLFYGRPHDLLTVGGYAAWRLAGFGSILVGAWAVLASVRALRGEEDAGRQELVLAGVVGRRGAYAAALAAVAAGAVVMWVATELALVGARLPLSGSAFLALATVAPAPVFAGVGALASQFAASRRGALQLGLGVAGAAFLLRVVADIANGAGAVRWMTPFGWVEELRPFAEPNPAPLLLIGVVAATLVVAAGILAAGRDVGTGLLPARDSSPPRLTLLSGPSAEAFRAERGTLLAWFAGTWLFAVVVGLLSTSFSTVNLSKQLRDELRKLGGVSIASPAGALGFYFLFFVLLVSLFGCAQLAAARREEVEQRLELMLALPLGRATWLGGRLLLTTGEGAALAVSAGVFAWGGAAAEGAGVSLGRMLAAGGNCLPAAVCFLGLGTLAYGVAPRMSAGVSYGLVVVAFVWQLFGSLLGAPQWLLASTPFEHVAAVPAQPFRLVGAVVLVAVGAAAAAVGLAAFRRRDLIAG